MATSRFPTFAYPRTLIALKHKRADRLPAQTRPQAGEPAAACPGPPSHDLNDAGGIVAAYQREVGAVDDLPGLLGDRGEHRATSVATRRSAACSSAS
jgi:hypothetical protein